MMRLDEIRLLLGLVSACMFYFFQRSKGRDKCQYNDIIMKDWPASCSHPGHHLALLIAVAIFFCRDFEAEEGR